MSPIVRPANGRRGHKCEPPALRPMKFPEGYRHPAGTTWDCPDCGRVWIARDIQGRYIGGGYLAGGRKWFRASWRQARRHRAALAGEA